jgi:membrane-bound lytic murein transglycosylase MltF
MKGILHASILLVTLSCSRPSNEAPNGPSLESFSEKLWVTCRASASEYRKGILLKQAVRAAQEAFSERSQQESFLLLICIESKFNPTAKSKAGALGLTQVMPKYASEFAGSAVSPEDLLDAEVNLSIGAKQFKALLDQFEGNVALALSGYNSGAHSPTTKGLAKLVPGHTETMAYVAKFYTLKEEMK